MNSSAEGCMLLRVFQPAISPAHDAAGAVAEAKSTLRPRLPMARHVSQTGDADLLLELLRPKNDSQLQLGCDAQQQPAPPVAEVAATIVHRHADSGLCQRTVDSASVASASGADSDDDFDLLQVAQAAARLRSSTSTSSDP